MVIPLYILAGGQSRRFGSDKARAVVEGRSLIQRVAECLVAEVGGVWVVADEAGKYADLGLRTIADCTAHLGPVNGLVTALIHCLAESGPGWIVLAPCDLTRPAPRWSEPLLEAIDLSAAGTAAAYVDPTGRWQPLPCVVHTDVLAPARAAIAAGERSLWRLLESIEASRVALPAGHDAVPAANSPRDLSNLETTAAAVAAGRPRAGLADLKHHQAHPDAADGGDR